MSLVGKVRYLFYLLSAEITSLPITLSLGSSGVRVGMAVCEILLSEFCLRNSFSLHLAEYFYLHNLGILNILVQK